jgi:hypothetical protein
MGAIVAICVTFAQAEAPLAKRGRHPHSATGGLTVFPSTSMLLTTLIIILDVLVIVAVLTGRASTGHKVLWTLMILLLPLIGLILYLVLGRDARDRPLIP